MWYDDWTYEMNILPANKRYRLVETEDTMMHFYIEDEVKYQLMVYAGTLYRSKDIQRLLDIAERGDGFARAKAFIALEDLDRDLATPMLEVWSQASEPEDTLDVSKCLCANRIQFKCARAVAYQLLQSRDRDHSEKLVAKTGLLLTSHNNQTLDDADTLIDKLPKVSLSSKRPSIKQPEKTPQRKRLKINLPKR